MMSHFCRTTLLIAIVVIYMACNIPRLALNLAEHLNQVRSSSFKTSKKTQFHIILVSYTSWLNLLIAHSSKIHFHSLSFIKILFYNFIYFQSDQNSSPGAIEAMPFSASLAQVFFLIIIWSKSVDLCAAPCHSEQKLINNFLARVPLTKKSCYRDSHVLNSKLDKTPQYPIIFILGIAGFKHRKNCECCPVSQLIVR